MIEVDYTNLKGDRISDTIKSLFLEFEDQVEKSKLVVVKAPFIFANNGFDLSECNNHCELVNLNRIKIVQFTGGSYYCVVDLVDKNKSGFLLFGNYEEGFTVFEIKSSLD